MYVGVFVEGGVSASVTEGESRSFSEECNGTSERFQHLCVCLVLVYPSCANVTNSGV